MIDDRELRLRDYNQWLIAKALDISKNNNRTMKLEEALKILEAHQEWRRYDGPIQHSLKMQDPKLIGEAIDVAIGKLSKKCGIYCNPQPVLMMVKEQKPYKNKDQRDTYSKYNEGWSDAVDSIAYHLNIEI